MLNQRLYLKAEKKGSPLLNPLSSMGNYSITQRPAWNVEATAANNDVLGALKILLTECERMRRFGFNANEFEGTMKHFYISINETSYIDRDFIPNIEYNLNYTANFLYNDPVPDAEWEYRTTKEIYEGMTIDTLNFYAKQYIHDHNMAFEIDMPDKAGVIVPAKDQVLALWNEVRNTKLKPYVKKKERNDLAKLKAPQPGTIIKTEKNTSPFGYTKWTFANGANVWFKRTDIKESTVFIDGRKQGGYSLVGLKDLPSAAAYNSIIPFSNRFNGFDGLVTYSQDLDKTEEKIFLKASVADLKLLFQQAYVNLTHFKKKPSEFNNWQTQELQFLKNRVVSSKTIFRDTLTAILRNHSPWALTLSDPAKLKAVNYNTIARLHKEFFGNAAGFTFIIAGNVSEDTVKSLAATWLGGLPSNGKTDQVVDHGDYPPPGIIKKHLVEKMVTPKTTVGIIYSGEIPLTAKNEALMGITTEILKTRYLATIRQKEGASYGVGVKGEVYKYPKERYYVQISFDTDPDTVKKEKMIAIVYDEIQKLIKDGPDKDILEKSRKDFTTTYEQYVQLKNSSYWSGVAAFYYENGFDYTVDYGNALRTVTPDEIQAFAKNVFSQGNLIEIKMDPAK